MPANEIHLNDVGTKFLVTIMDGSSAVDISTASTKQIIIQKPSPQLNVGTYGPPQIP